mmetsp:Transcript_5948/g.11132  ORF Transcript_5948/g.11132 Transcript_5948/m.11132 type:complete len:225 (+) Transcript_5948:457-1131(+)
MVNARGVIVAYAFLLFPVEPFFDCGINTLQFNLSDKEPGAWGSSLDGSPKVLKDGGAGDIEMQARPKADPVAPFERVSRASSIDEDWSASVLNSKQQDGLSRPSSNIKTRNPTHGRSSRDSRDFHKLASRNKNSSPLHTRPIRAGLSDVKTKETGSSSTSDSLTSDSSSKKQAVLSRQPSKENTQERAPCKLGNENGPLARQISGSDLNSDAELGEPGHDVEMV